MLSNKMKIYIVVRQAGIWHEEIGYYKKHNEALKYMNKMETENKNDCIKNKYIVKMNFYIKEVVVK